MRPLTCFKQKIMNTMKHGAIMRVSSMTDIILMKLLRCENKLKDIDGKTLVSEGIESQLSGYD